MKYTSAAPRGAPALTRLKNIATLDAADMAALEAAVADSQLLRRHLEFQSEGARIDQPRIIVDGWAARVRILVDGRRQFLSFLLPGDLLGYCHQDEPVATSSVVALTDIAVCTAPSPENLPGLRQAYAMSQAHDEAYLLAHIARLGRMTAQERLADLMLELHERLSLCGLAMGESFRLPLTQETLADSVGLTSVHVNRTLQLARRAGDISLKHGLLTLHDPAGLARRVGRTPVRVSAQTVG